MIQVSLDVFLWCTLKVLLTEFHLADRCIGREHLVDFRHPGAQASLQFLSLDSVSGGSSVVRQNEGCKSVGIFNHQGIDYVRDVVDDRLKLLRIDVLTVGRKNHTLDASLQIKATRTDDTHIPRFEPTVLSKGLLGGLFVLVVAQEDIASAYLNLSRYLLRVRRVDADLAARNNFAG